MLLKIWGAAGPIYLAAGVYARLGAAQPATAAPAHAGSGARGRWARVGAIPELAVPAVGAVGMRAASGFLLFLLAFSLRDEDAPTYWFAVLAAGGIVGGFLADIVAPRVPTTTREEAVVIACVSAACIGALLAFELFGLPLLTVFTVVAGAATEFGRLAFQSLMQRHAPPGAQGRVFVRYEVLLPARVGRGRVHPGVAADRLPGRHPDPRRRSTGSSAVVSVWRGHSAQGPSTTRSRDGRRKLRPVRRVLRERDRRNEQWRSSSPSARPTRCAEGEAKAFAVDGQEIAVARVGGALYAFSDICTHRGCNLAQRRRDRRHRRSTASATAACSTWRPARSWRARPPSRSPSFGVRDEGGELQVEV